MDELKNRNLLLPYFDDPVIFLSPDQLILDLNPSALNLYGWKRERVIEKNFSDILKEQQFKNPLPKEYPLYEGGYSVENIFTTIKKKSKEITMRWKIRSVMDEQGIFQGILLIAHDMTLQNKLEDKLHELDSVIAQMPGNVYWYDKNFTYLGCNDNSAKTLGLSRQEAMGKNFKELMKRLGDISELSINQMVQDGLDVIQSGNAKLNISEAPYVAVDGTMMETLANKVPLLDRQGRLYGVLGISTDIAQQKSIQDNLKQAKEEAEASNHAKTDFLSNMSHDVKTPLSGIISLAELLSFRVQPELHDLTQGLMDSGKQLMSFFENCIELSKIENHSLVPSKENFSLKELLQELLQLFRPAIIAKNLFLYIECSEKIPARLLGSRANLYRSLLNLMGNAIKFTNQGFVKITVALSQRSTDKQAMIQLKVIDTGVGIPRNKQNSIFEKFSRLTPSSQGNVEGHGIGLYIVQQFVESMQGQISVKSKEGEGSQFILAIPFEYPLLADDEYDSDDNTADIDLSLLQVLPQDKISNPVIKPILETTPPLPQEEVPTDASKTNILLIEDDAKMQMVARMLLEGLGCHVDIANCGEKAIALFKPGKYGLIFMDIGLPDMKGYELAKRLRETEKQTSFHVPILGLSAYVSEEETALSVDAGMEEMLSKPLLMDQAKKHLERYVA